ncbi:MAG TPA: MAPEG family protein [Polyangium sp.]|nr:MAPEG family protein [Polyangium sp.]
MLKQVSLTALVTALALLTYMVISINVGRARVKFDVKPPNTTGNPNFERYMRVQQNMLENIVPFLGGLWLFSVLVDPKIGAGLGGVWILGRILYAWGYYQAAEKRGPGFGIAILAQLALILGSIYGAIMNVLH